MPNQSFTDPVLYGRPRPCRTKSESQASTSQLRQQTGAKASARRSPDQAAPGQAQDTHQDKQRRCKHQPSKLPPGQTPATTPPSRQVPRQAQDTLQTKRCQGKRRTPIKTSNAEVSSRRANTHQDKQRQTKRRQVYKPKSPASMETGDFSCRDPELLVAVL